MVVRCLNLSAHCQYTAVCENTREGLVVGMRGRCSGGSASEHLAEPLSPKMIECNSFAWVSERHGGLTTEYTLEGLLTEL